MRADVQQFLTQRTTRTGDHDLHRLLAAKRATGTTISVVLPAKDEERTVGTIVATLLQAWTREVPLVDELVVMDSNSTDATAAVSAAAGARVVHVQDVLPHLGSIPGKGEALWKSLAVTTGDLLVFLDADLVDVDPGFVLGLVGPLLTDPQVGFVKGFYDRPLATTDGLVPTGGGRVTELLARPLLNALWPDLAGVVQPLGGEYAGRRSLLERVPFASGYGVDLGLLVDVTRLAGVKCLAQVDLGVRRHSHQSDAALGRMAGQVLQTALARLPDGGPTADDQLLQFVRTGEEVEAVGWDVSVSERPPMAQVLAVRPMRVLMDAGPWLPVPPVGYGGLENVVATLIDELRARGHEVVLATVEESTLDAEERVWAFPTGQFARLAGSYASVVGVAHAHAQAVADTVARYAAAGVPFDVVHTHLEVVGPAVLAALGSTAPPVLHTLHWDLHRNLDFYEQFDGRGRVSYVGVSASQLARGPARLRAQALGSVPLAVPLPEDPPLPVGARAPHALLLARLTAVKGADTAIAACAAAGVPLVLAGPVGGLPDAAALNTALADPDHPAHGNADVAWFCRHVRPHLDGERVRWVGSVAGAEKAELLRTARVSLFPIDWEEPGGTAVCESLAAGTPVVAMARGCLPALVEHGVTGFLASDLAGFVDGLRRVGEIDPARCATVARARFAPAVMARAYEHLYAQVLGRATDRTQPLTVPGPRTPPSGRAAASR
jgi:glycosyltransferase involved in cell wall biosynthesis